MPKPPIIKPLNVPPTLKPIDFKVAEELPVKNYNVLSPYSNTNISDNDSTNIWNSFANSMEVASWAFIKENITVQVLPQYSVTVGITQHLFDSNNNIDLSVEFNNFLTKDGLTLLGVSYLPLQPESIVPRKYVDSRTAYSFTYKNNTTIGAFLDTVPTEQDVQDVVTGYATESYVTNALNPYILANGTKAFTGSVSLGNNVLTGVQLSDDLSSVVPRSYLNDCFHIIMTSIEVTYVKLLPTVPKNFNNQFGINLLDGVNPQDAATKNQMDILKSSSIQVNGTSTITADIPLNGHKFTSLAPATANGQAVRFDEFSSVPKTRLKDDMNYPSLSIVVSTNSAAPTNLLTGLTNSIPNTFIATGKIYPKNFNTYLGLQITLTGNFTVGLLLPMSMIVITASDGVKTKVERKIMGTAGATNTILAYSFIPWSIDIGGATFTNGITLSAYVINGTATITTISCTIVQFIT